MEQMIAYCGIDCYACPAYKATQNNNDDERAKVAAFWSKLFHSEIKAKDINCDGCLSKGGKLFGHCLQCEIRSCGEKRSVKNCAYCNDYACEKLTNLWKILPIPSSKENLDKIRKNL